MTDRSIAESIQLALTELITAGSLKPRNIIVFGVSTSEIVGKAIGTAGTLQAASQLYAGIVQACQLAGCFPAFQCCEHLNRALVVSRELLDYYPLEEVSVVPVAKAGGSMAAYAYTQLTSPIVIEHISAHAGIDIGDTLIGMHLRPVAVPYRPSVRSIGEARLIAAYTRPKLIGGARACYTAAEGHTL